MNSETTDDDCCGWASASSTTKFGWSKLEFLRKNTGIVWDCFTYIFTIYLNCWFGFRNHPQARWFLLISRSYFYHIGISINGGTRKSSILMGFSITNQPFRGIPIYGNPHMFTIHPPYQPSALITDSSRPSPASPVKVRMARFMQLFTGAPTQGCLPASFFRFFRMVLWPKNRGKWA